jgi:hypothetical protein
MGEGKGCCETEQKGGCCPGGGKNKLIATVLVVAALAAGAFVFCKGGFCPVNKGSTVEAQK